MFLPVLALIIFVSWFYILFVREWAVSRWPDHFGPWYKLEEWLWLNSRQILIARLYWVGGILIGLHETLAQQGFDVTPFLVQIEEYIPERWRPMLAPFIIPVFLGATGVLIEWLRRITTEPLDAKVDRESSVQQE